MSRRAMQRTGTIGTIIKEGHIRIILAKFGENPACSFGAIVDNSQIMMDIKQSQTVYTR